MQLEICLYLSYGDKSAIFSSSSTLSLSDIGMCAMYARMFDFLKKQNLIPSYAYKN